LGLTSHLIEFVNPFYWTGSLEEERWDDENGKPEPLAALVIRKLTKLMKLEQQGY
jgi:hypothetical protein